MWPHFSNLIHRSWQLFLTGQGTTNLGFISVYTIPFYSAIIAGFFILVLRGKSEMIAHGKRSVGLLFGAAVMGNVLWFGPILSWELIKTTYNDHAQLVERVGRMNSERVGLQQSNQALEQENAQLKSQLAQQQTKHPGGPGSLKEHGGTGDSIGWTRTFGNESKLRIRKGLGDLINEGTPIRDKAPFWIGDAPPEFKAQWNAWTAKVETFLMANYDAAEVTKFHSLDDPTNSWTGKLHAEIGDLESLMDQISHQP
jgi:hypothetical protein